MRILLAFIITVVIYGLLIWLYLTNFQRIKLPKYEESPTIIKIDILDIPHPKKKKIIKNKIVKTDKIDKKINKKIVKNKKTKIKKKRKIVKKEDKKRNFKTKNEEKAHIYKKKILKNNIKEDKEEFEDKFIPESEIIYIPDPFIKEIIRIDNSELIDNIDLEADIDYPNHKIEKLYGNEFHSYTPNQKIFIEKNLDEIHKITQNKLWERGYPNGAISAKMGQEGVNIVSFYIHPNGNISALKLKKRVGYSSLDDNTIETIKSAYKDYPYPNEKTKIIFYVEYSIFGY
jgi:TonB family protein